MKLLYSFIGLILLNSSLFSSQCVQQFDLNDAGTVGDKVVGTALVSDTPYTTNGSASAYWQLPNHFYGNVLRTAVSNNGYNNVAGAYYDIISSPCSCPNGGSFDSDGHCVVSPCQPLSNAYAPLSEDECIDNLPYSDKKIKSGILLYQTCSHTCWVLEAVPKTCEEAASDFKISCDLDLNFGSFSCTKDDKNSESIIDLNTSCTPKNQFPISSPCDKKFEEMKIICSNNNQKVLGTCNDNGIVITKNTLECVDKVPECDTNWHEHLDIASGACKCDVGFVRTILGDCRLPFPWENDENLTDEQKATIASANGNLNNAHNIAKANDDDNSSFGFGGFGINNDTLAGIRSDINTTNNLLKSIKDKLDSNDTTAFSYSSPNMDSQNQIMSAFDTVTTSIDNIKSDYDSLLSKVQQGFSASPVSNGVTPSFTAQVFGHTIILDMCASFSAFYSIGYFVFSIIFIIIGVRIFLYAFMMGV